MFGEKKCKLNFAVFYSRHFTCEFHIFYIFFGFFILETQVTYLIFLVPVDSSGFLPGCFYFSSPFPQLYYFPVT